MYQPIKPFAAYKLYFVATIKYFTDTIEWLLDWGPWYHSLAYPLATSCASPGILDALEDVSTDSAASFCAKLTAVLFCADLSFCARSATAEALRGVLNVRPITSALRSGLVAFVLVDASSEDHKEYTIIL